MAAAGPTLVLLLSIFAVGVGLLTYGLLALVQLLRLRRARGRGVDAATGGIVSLDGTVTSGQGGDRVGSPLTGRASHWYEYAVQRHRGEPSRANWTDVETGGDGQPFALDTGDGTVHVDPAGATVEVAPALDVDLVADPEDADELRAACATVAVAEETIDVGVARLEAGTRYRLVERRIEPGDVLAVSGTATVSAAADGASVALGAPATRGRLGRLIGLPFVVGEPGDGVRRTLRDRTLVGLVFGLPLTMLSTVYLFPPGL